MNNPLAFQGISRIDGHRRFAAENLKRCPLCGAVNVKDNFSCFLCSWAGQFDYEAEAVEAGLEELLLRCPELADLLVELPAPVGRVQAGLTAFWRWITRRKVDYWV